MKWYLAHLLGHGLQGQRGYLAFLTLEVVGVERVEDAGPAACEAVFARVRKDYGAAADALVVEWTELEELACGPANHVGLLLTEYQNAAELAEFREAAYTPSEDDADESEDPTSVIWFKRAVIPMSSRIRSLIRRIRSMLQI